jgi:hypothetical protein
MSSLSDVMSDPPSTPSSMFEGRWCAMQGSNLRLLACETSLVTS